MKEKAIYTVTQVNEQVERLVAGDKMLSDVSIEGEVSNCKYNQSGHIYFTLKDQSSALSCVMFAGKRWQGLKFQMKDGDKVVAAGYVGVYTTSGRYQLYAESITLSGIGSLYQKFEELKRKLSAEGLFEPARKKRIPSYAMKIGIVTAPTGAAVRDIIRVARLRNPFVQIVIYPAVVQGEAAPASVVAGIAALDDMGLDVLIVGRGGGSIEDLWAFNEEIVARAISDAKTPIVSAVGHETDVTIADFVADVRAATPSQAAELTTFVYADFHKTLVRYADRLDRIMEHRLEVIERSIEGYRSRLLSLRPDRSLQSKMEKLQALRQRLDTLMQSKLEHYRSRLVAMAGRLEGVSPEKKLTGGFGYITTSQDEPINSVQQLTQGTVLKVRLRDGVATSMVTEIETNQP